MSGKKVTVRKQKIKKNHIREKLIFFTILTLILLIVAAVARKLCPYDPYAQDLLLAQKPPGPEHILGTEIGMVFQDCKAVLCLVRKIGVQIHEAVSAHEKISKKETFRRSRQVADTNLKAEHLTKTFISGKKTLTAVDDVSFELKQRECLGIVGESGSGKSTIAKMLTHLESITDGKVILKGKDIINIKGKELREIYRDIQMVFQMPMESFDPRCTLGDGIGESLRNMGISRTETRRKVEELLERCGLEKEYADRYPHQVSGGQCQRAAIARALAVNLSILICDEATSALDVTVQKQILELLIELKKKENLSFILICHDLALVQAFCDRVFIMERLWRAEHRMRPLIIHRWITQEN